MAKHTHTNYSYTCDLCGNEMPDEGTQLVGMIVDLQQAVNPRQLPVAQFCADCRARTIADLAKHFGSQELREAVDSAKRKTAEQVKQRRESH